MSEAAHQTSTSRPKRPSLIRSSGERPDGLLPGIAWRLVRVLEPIGYVAAGAIGLGLWILLGDYLVGLSDGVTLALLGVSAAALWWAAYVVGNYPFAETWRLGNAIYAAAIGTSGWIVWLATERWLEGEVRFTLAAATAAFGSYIAQRLRGDLVTWTILVLALFATGISAGVALGAPVEDREAGLAIVGALVAAGTVNLLAGSAEKSRYELTTLMVLLASFLTLLAALGLPTPFALGAAAAGVGVAFTAFFATRPASQFGKISAGVNGVLAILVALVQIEVRLPIVLVVVGSGALAVLSWAARKVLGSSPEIVEDDPPPAPEPAPVSPPSHEPPTDPAMPPTAPVAATSPPLAPPQRTNGMAIASFILGITWIFWMGSLLAVILGHLALKQTDAPGSNEGGRGFAVAGLALGYMGLGFGALIVMLLTFGRGFNLY